MDYRVGYVRYIFSAYNSKNKGLRAYMYGRKQNHEIRHFISQCTKKGNNKKSNSHGAYTNISSQVAPMDSKKEVTKR